MSIKHERHISGHIDTHTLIDREILDVNRTVLELELEHNAWTQLEDDSLTTQSAHNTRHQMQFFARVQTLELFRA